MRPKRANASVSSRCPGKHKTSVPTQRAQDLLEIAIGDRTRQIDTLDPGAECASPGLERHALAL